LLPAAFRGLGPRELLVNEFFHSLQGESSFAGRPCFFIRLSACQLRCSYCDTDYAFYEGRVETVESCLERAAKCGCPLVEVTGGEPLLQKAVYPLLTALCDRGFTVLLETSGSVPLTRVDPRVKKIVDVKTPGSGMSRYQARHLSAQLRPGDELKFVIADRRDYEWAVSWLQRQPELDPASVPVHFSPVHGRLEPAELARWILEDGLQVRLNLQLHKYIWPASLRGV
jgi:7-carboxy-7-deazaguanine synthase